jgi:hypothetical protein
MEGQASLEGAIVSRRWKSAALLGLAIVMVAILLSGCGSGGDETNEHPSTTTAGAPAKRAIPEAEESSHPAPSRKQASPASNNDKERRTDRHQPAARHKKTPKSSKSDTAAGQEASSESSGQPAGEDRQQAGTKEPTKPARCPSGLSSKRCHQAQTAAKEAEKGSGKSSPSCPQSVERSVCEAALEPAPPASTESPDQAPSCPPTLSEAECAEIANAYGNGER